MLLIHKRVTTIGQVAFSEFTVDFNILSGWACTADGSSIDSLRVVLPGGNSVDSFDYRLGVLVKGDLCRYFPKNSLMCDSGFEIIIPRDLLNVFSGHRLQIVPSLNGEEGEPLEWVWAPALPVPEDDLINLVGGGGRESFLRVGFEFLGHFIHKAKLSSDARVLDVGCGVGRMAYALAHYLESNAVYEGFDVCEESIDWANREIGGLHSNFAFKRIDLRHDLYNPKGVVDSLEFRFPYDDSSMDFVFLASVFTHMSAPEIRVYLNEIRRVLRSGGTCLMTAFIMDEISISLCKQGKSSQCFDHRWCEGFTVNPERPEDAVAFEEGLFLDWLNQAGYELNGLFPGYWSGRSFGHSYQDLLVATVS